MLKNKLYNEGEANYPRLMTDKLFADYSNEFRYNGFIDKAFGFIEDFQLLREDLWTRFVQQFREDADYEGGWRGEYWGKMMRGASFIYSYTKNEKLYEVLTKTVYDMLASADNDGRISSYAKSHEFEAWDIWCRKYVLLGMQYFMEICRDDELKKKLTESMCAQADYIMSKVGDGEGKIQITKATRHWRGLNSSSLLEPVVRLYNITNERKYLDFATYIVECGGTDVTNIFEIAYENKLPLYSYPVTKAYEMTSCFEGLLEYYRITGNEKHKTALINYANRILEDDFTIIGCSGCTHELFDHSTVRQANTTNHKIMQETCVTVTLMKFFYQLTLLTGDTKYSDAFEISMYNAYLGTINTDKVTDFTVKKEHPSVIPEPLPFDSYSPLTAGTRGNGVGGMKVMSDNHYYGCCVCIGAAGLGLIPKMALLTSENGIMINMYFDGVAKTKTPSGKALTIKTVTKYPADGKIHIEFETNADEEFEIMVRIPRWSKNSKVASQNAAIETNDGYVKLCKKWQTGDYINIELDMTTRVIRPIPYGSQVLNNNFVEGANFVAPTYDEEDPIAKNHMALKRGPVILAQENRLGYSVDEPIEIAVNNDDTVNITFPENDIAPYEHIIEVCVPLKDGKMMHVTDYASAGKKWTEESKMAAWMLTK